jgi:glycosyltransferase involved in cell wall biosynthesis
MRILMVLENSFPPDERVENEIAVLLKSGFHITLICAKRPGENEKEEKENLSIIRITVPRLIYKSGALALELPFYFNFWKKHIRKILNEACPDAIHLHDLPLAKVCRELADEFHTRLVFDYHENRPEIMRMYHHVNNFPGKLLISPDRWLRYQERITGKADRLILVTEEAKDYYVSKYSVDPARITVLPNYIAFDRFRKLIPEAVEKNKNDSFMLSYFGDTGLRRGTITIIEAAAKLRDRNITFCIIGTSREQPVLEREIKNRGLTNVTLTGWLAPVEAMKLINKSDAGICPFLRNIHHDTTYANKMFQYMALGKPVIVSDCTAQASFVERENCGLVFNAGNSEDLCVQIIRIMDSGLYKALGINAMNCVNEKYNWERSGSVLTGLYSDLQKIDVNE